MIRTQIQLPERQVTALKRLSAKHSLSMAELIRRAIDQMLDRTPPIRDEAEIRRRAMNAIGFIHSGLGDLAREHDKYLVEAYEGRPRK